MMQKSQQKGKGRKGTYCWGYIPNNAGFRHNQSKSSYPQRSKEKPIKIKEKINLGLNATSDTEKLLKSYTVWFQVQIQAEEEVRLRAALDSKCEQPVTTSSRAEASSLSDQSALKQGFSPQPPQSPVFHNISVQTTATEDVLFPA